MTPDQLSEFVRHLPVGATVTFSITLQQGPAPVQPGARSEGTPTVVEEGGPLKTEVCAQVFGLPARELRRAMRRRFLPFTTKSDGRDAGAHLIRPADAESYKARRERIRGGDEAPPPDWPGPGGVRV